MGKNSSYRYKFTIHILSKHIFRLFGPASPPLQVLRNI